MAAAFSRETSRPSVTAALPPVTALLRSTRIGRRGIADGRVPFGWRQIPVQSETNGIGAQIPTEKPGVGSPGGGGGGGGGRPTHLSVAASNTVPGPHSVALPTPGDTTPARDNADKAIAAMNALRRYEVFIAHLLELVPIGRGNSRTGVGQLAIESSPPQGGLDLRARRSTGGARSAANASNLIPSKYPTVSQITRLDSLAGPPTRDARPKVPGTSPKQFGAGRLNGATSPTARRLGCRNLHGWELRTRREVLACASWAQILPIRDLSRPARAVRTDQKQLTQWPSPTSPSTPT